MVEAVLRPATDDDAAIVWRLRNADDVRKASFDPTPIELDAHRRWFHERLRDGSTRLYLVLDPARDPVGFVRFDVDDDRAEIAVALTAAARGRGVGRAAIRQGSLAVLGELARVSRVVARVKPGNAASLGAFRGAGFREAGRDDDVVELVFARDDA